MYFEVERINRQLMELAVLRYRERQSVESALLKEGDFRSFEEAQSSSAPWQKFLCGKEQWGDPDKRYWFRLEVEIPKDFQDKEVMFHLKTGKENEWDFNRNPQFLLYIDGTITQGMDINHYALPMIKKATGGKRVIIDLRAYSGTGDHHVEFIPSISLMDRPTEDIFYDIKVPLEVARRLPKDDLRRIELLQDLTYAVNLIDFRTPYSKDYYRSIEAARNYLQKVLYQNKERREAYEVTCVGHTHIDVAWLWNLRQTKEKVVRSFATVLKLMEEYPEYIFMSSQPQLYKFLQKEAPELYTKVKKQVAAGVWEPEGAMFVEADCNLSSGESLVRQILHGTRFFRKEFGVENKTLWLPDVFGYSAALPQILKLFGIDYFMTTKISWNEYNKMPYDTFMWQGIDGSEVLTHFISTTKYKEEGEPNTFTTYNGMLEPGDVMGAWQRYQQKGVNKDILLCYGHGDGGGGVTRLMLENGRRLSQGIPGAPTVKMGKVATFFEGLEERVKDRATAQGSRKLPKWVGELYLEYHRGTYTSMAKNKWYNRKCEILLQNIELFASYNREFGDGNPYPQQELEELWELVLLNQFHDILPGSSVKSVYEDSHRQYEEVMSRGTALLNRALDGIAATLAEDVGSLMIANPLGVHRSDVFTIHTDSAAGVGDAKDVSTLLEKSALLVEGEEVLFQKTYDNRYITSVEAIPAKGVRSFPLVPATKKSGKTPFVFQKNQLTTPWHRITFTKEGEIGSFVYFGRENAGDSASGGASATGASAGSPKSVGRELLTPGAVGNRLTAYEDKPHNYDAWDINIYYTEKQWPVNQLESLELVENGIYRAVIKLVRKYQKSTIVQEIICYANTPRVDFKTTVDWHEKHTLLKTAFPLDIHGVKATCDIQFGNVERSIHNNTSWDAAQFEVAAHKWVDLSESNFGVALLNECKYGYDIKNQLLGLTLIKSATLPNPDADQGEHAFTYALYPHSGDCREGRVQEEAFSLNYPMESRVIGCSPVQGASSKVGMNSATGSANKAVDSAVGSFVSFLGGSPLVELETVKKAEDRDGYIIRLYEYGNQRTSVTLEFKRELKVAEICDLHERPVESLDILSVSNGASAVASSFRPYEIKTLYVEFA